MTSLFGMNILIIYHKGMEARVKLFATGFEPQTFSGRMCPDKLLLLYVNMSPYPNDRAVLQISFDCSQFIITCN